MNDNELDFDLEDNSQNPQSYQGDYPQGYAPSYQQNNGGQNYGGYDPNQGGYSQGGYNPNQGGYNPNQGGYNPNQGGYNPNQGGYSQGGYDPNQGGYNPNQGGYDPNQGGQFDTGYQYNNQAQNTSNTEIKEYNSAQHNRYANISFSDAFKLMIDNIKGLFNNNTLQNLFSGFDTNSIANTYRMTGNLNVSEITSRGLSATAANVVIIAIIEVLELLRSILLGYRVGGQFVSTIIIIAIAIAIGAVVTLVLCKFKNCWSDIAVKIFLSIAFIDAACYVIYAIRLLFNLRYLSLISILIWEM